MVVVTGASGHLGAALVRALLDEGQQVRALVHYDQRALIGLDVEVAKGDVREVDTLTQAFTGADVVYHSAAHISMSDADWPMLEAMNVVGTRNVVQACLAAGVRRLLYVGSHSALDGRPFSKPVDEQNPYLQSAKIFPYGYSKALAEQEVKKGIEQGLDAVIVRPTAILGPYDFRLGATTRAIVDGSLGKVTTTLDGGCDFVDARDVAFAAIQAVAKAPCGASYNLSGEWLSMLDAATRIARVTGTQPPTSVLPSWLAQIIVTVGEWQSRFTKKPPQLSKLVLHTINGNRNISHERAAKELGYVPRPIDDTIIDTVRFFEEIGVLAPAKNRVSAAVQA